MPNYCIMNFKTYNTAASIRAVQNEATRAKTYDNIDSSRSHLNETILGDMDYCRSLREALKSDYYTKPDKSGRLHKEPEVKGLGFVLSYSPEASGSFEESKWIEENKRFLEETFKGAKIHAVVHRDETTLHIQGMIIPTTESGKICKSHYIRDKAALVKLQDLYASRMAIFGLQRGEKGKTQDREKEQAKTVRRLRAKIKALEDERDKDKEIIERLNKRLQKAENELKKIREPEEAYMKDLKARIFGEER